MTAALAPQCSAVSLREAEPIISGSDHNQVIVAPARLCEIRVATHRQSGYTGLENPVKRLSDVVQSVMSESCDPMDCSTQGFRVLYHLL